MLYIAIRVLSDWLCLSVSVVCDLCFVSFDLCLSCYAGSVLASITVTNTNECYESLETSVAVFYSLRGKRVQQLYALCYVRRVSMARKSLFDIGGA